ncbi:MAG: hypothetical protein JXR54_09835 [Tannerellaceae bacterium]|nr:hypothetical protein [Tannerellaceae bacterium]
MKTFEEWWFEYGSGMRPEPEEDMETFAKRVAKVSWEISSRILKQQSDE